MRLLTVLILTVTCSSAESLDSAWQAAWTAIDECLRDGGSDHRQQAIAALTTIDGDAQAAVKVESALRDKDVIVRQYAAIALGELKASVAIPALKKIIQNDSPEVSFAAAKALTQMGEPDGREVLIAVLAGERRDAPGLITNALRKAKDKLHHPEGLILMGAQDATGAMFGPVSMAFPAIKDVTKMKGKGAPGRAAATAYIARDPDPYAITLLEWALSDENGIVRLEAAKGLGERGNAQSVPRLQPLLTDQHRYVRAMAAAAIIRICDRNGARGEVSQDPVTPATPKKK